MIFIQSLKSNIFGFGNKKQPETTGFFKFQSQQLAYLKFSLHVICLHVILANIGENGH